MIVSTNLDLYAVCAGPFVITGRRMGALTEFEREAIVWHEWGHMHHMHALKRLWWLISFQWNDLEARCEAQEYEADRYAVAHGQAVALMQFLGRMNPTHKSPLHPTAGDRIANIKRWLSYVR